MAVFFFQHRVDMAALLRAVTLRAQDLPVAALRTAIQLFLALYCCYLLGRIFWMVLPLPQLSHTPADMLQSHGQLTGVEREQGVPLEIAALKELHLFGRPDVVSATSKAVMPVAIVAEQTALDLLLLGVMVSDNLASARAIIAHHNQQDLFAVGDKLPGGSQVQLEQVLPGRVIINNQGNYESLWLYDDAAVQQPPQHTIAHAPTPPTAPAKAISKPASVPVEREVAQAVVSASPAAIAEAGTLADIIKFTPVHANGQILGYRIAPGRAPQLFDRFGLQKNDVITSINGIALDDPAKALKVYRQVQAAKSASFELVRDGRSHIVAVTLDDKHA
jgi:general secretion pathway protein C